jgi:hypothetical protein
LLIGKLTGVWSGEAAELTNLIGFVKHFPRTFKGGNDIRMPKITVHSQMSAGSVVRGFTCPQVQLSAGSLVRGFTCPQTCKICRVGRNNGGIV